MRALEIRGLVATYRAEGSGRRGALTLLADAGVRGVLEVLLVDVYGFTLACPTASRPSTIRRCGPAAGP
jgi:hypothetical protein